ncbi:MAG: GNAT family N-acetyltransferase [Pirellulales bacterium]|nr:GNAT family N-acetyltransferase [Pirellulales bacterium]
MRESLPADLQAVLADALRKTDEADEAAWDGLLVCAPPELTASSIEGAAWVQQVAGNSGVLWAPPGDGAVAERLYAAAARFADDLRIPLTQIAVARHGDYSPKLLSRCGFPKLCELIYLYADLRKLDSRVTPLGEASNEANAGTAGMLEFVPHAARDAQRLSALLERTYRGTLDCPQLEDVRSLSDVLEGYQAQGRYAPDEWFFVSARSEDVGTVILAEHPEFRNWELVYMGVVPERRGCGIGEQIVRFALRRATIRGGERLVLAVDEVNAPGRDVYRRCGLHEWDRRIVYARLHRRP